jgi:hypothetical protein
VRQVVGYDRFVGELAYRQLTGHIRRALHVNCFQPSMNTDGSSEKAAWCVST